MENNNTPAYSSDKTFVKIKVFAALIIIFTVFRLQAQLNPQPWLLAYLKPFGIIFYISGILASLLKIIFAIGILHLKEWARKYLVILMIIGAGFIFINKFFYNKIYWQSLEQKITQEYQNLTLQHQQTGKQGATKFEEIIKKYPQEEQARLRQFYSKLNNELPVILFRAANLSASTIALFWHLLLIYFFTLPQTKERFN